MINFKDKKILITGATGGIGNALVKKFLSLDGTVLATGTNEEEQNILNEILNSEFKERCIPLDKITIKETLPIIKNCNIAVCNDSSFSHLSAALDVPTIVLLSDTPLMYGSYSPNMYPIIPDGEETVTHNTLGKERINPEKIFKMFKEILN